MGAKHIDGELFYVCQNIACGKVSTVPNRRLQKVRKYCSLRCSAIQRNRNPEALAASISGVQKRIRMERERLMEGVKEMDPVAAFRAGYLRGLYSKHRQMRKWRARKVAA